MQHKKTISTVIAKTIRLCGTLTSALCNFFRLLYLQLKYPGLCVDFKTRIESGCKIVCVDGGRLVIRNSFISGGTHLFCNTGAELTITGTFIGRNCIVVAHKNITVDDGCAVAEMVVVRDQNHQVDFTNLDETLYNFDTAPIHIQKHVWIGAKATLLKGVTVGEQAVVAASAVVVKSIPAGEIWGGIPAKYIKNYDYHTNRTLCKTQFQAV